MASWCHSTSPAHPHSCAQPAPPAGAMHDGPGGPPRPPSSRTKVGQLGAEATWVGRVGCQQHIVGGHVAVHQMALAMQVGQPPRNVQRGAGRPVLQAQGRGEGGRTAATRRMTSQAAASGAGAASGPAGSRRRFPRHLMQSFRVPRNHAGLPVGVGGMQKDEARAGLVATRRCTTTTHQVGQPPAAVQEEASGRDCPVQTAQ